jgi:hypothetical protein
MTDKEKINELKEEVKKYIEAINSYSGNEITGYRPFNNLMIEEKIDILVKVISLLAVQTSL